MTVIVKSSLLIIYLTVSLFWSVPLSATEVIEKSNQPSTFIQDNLTQQERLYLQNLPVLNVPLITHQPPLSFIDNDQPAGYLNALLDHLTEILQLKINRTSDFSYAESLNGLMSDQLDLLNDYSAFGPNRKSIIHTKPVLTIPFVAVGRVNEDLIRTIKQLKGKTVVLVSGFQQSKTIQQRYEEINTIFVDSIDQAYRALRMKDADYYIDNATHAGYFLQSKMINDLQISGEFSEEEMGLLELRFALKKDRPLLLSSIEKALDSISNRKLQELRNKWLITNDDKKSLQLTVSEKKWLDDHPIIRLASDSAWLPFETIDKKGDFKGIAAEYIQLIETRLGIQFEVSPVKPWSEITALVKTRGLDLFSCAMATEERQEYAIFTRPYVSNPMVIVTRENVGYIDGIQGLKGKMVSVEQDYASYELLKKNHPELQLQTYENSQSAILAVSKGKAFAYIGNIANLSHIVRTHGITNTRISGQIPYSFELAMGVRSDWPEFLPILQKALDSISLEEKNTILQRWVGINYSQEFDYTLIWQLASVVILLFVVIIYWNLLLKRKVKERTSQLQRQAHYDALTGLPNRVLVLDRLNQLIIESRRKSLKVALLFIDLDDFKKINDTLGHDTGDKLLEEAADRLRATLRADDTVGRLGGDEFIVVCGELKEPSDTAFVAENLITKFREAFIHEGSKLLLTASVGIAIYPEDGSNASELLKNADVAMYNSKRQGRNTFSYFDDSMNNEVARRLVIEQHMNSALNNNELEVLFQPKVDLATDRIVGAEALLRWNNPDLGNISPFEFIPVAEHNGMIVPIGFFVITRALTASAKWIEYDPTFTIAVNMSPRQFRDPSLVQTISSLIQKSGLPARTLEIEITEGILMSGHTVIEEALTALKKLGISLAMDDFGTGYSSLSYLRKYPFDVLKIDREFINDIFLDNSDRELVCATISMAHALGLKVVAEGVETNEQRSFLAAKKCDLAQGYLFSKAVSEEQLTHLLDAQYLSAS